MDVAATAVLIGAIFTGVAGLTTAVVTAIISARKSQLDSLKTIIDQQNIEIEQLRAQMKEYEAERHALKESIRQR